METVSQQGLARFAPPDSSTDARGSLCGGYARSDACARDHSAVLQKQCATTSPSLYARPAVRVVVQARDLLCLLKTLLVMNRQCCGCRFLRGGKSVGRSGGGGGGGGERVSGVGGRSRA